MSHSIRIKNAVREIVTNDSRAAAEDLAGVIHEIIREYVAQNAAQSLPPGWWRAEDDSYGPVFVGPDGARVEVNLKGKSATITESDDGIPIAVLRAFLAALDEG